MSEQNKFPIIWAIFGTMVVLGIMWVTTMVSVYNYGNRAENGIKAEYENLGNVLGQYSLKVSEAAQIPEMYRDDVATVVKDAIQGRYGEKGSQAVFQVLREDNSPAKLDSSLYTKIQQIIEGGRNEYQNTQTRFIDLKRSYSTSLGSLVTGGLLRSFGYPHINLDDYKTVTTSSAQNALKTGVDEGLTIRKK